LEEKNERKKRKQKPIEENILVDPERKITEEEKSKGKSKIGELR
jgi:hypothetical protein